MKHLVLIALGLLTVSCHRVKDDERDLAACQLRGLGPEGTIYRRNYSKNGFVPGEKDVSYRDFISTCMQSKGYGFAEPRLSGDTLNDSCWVTDPNSIIPDMKVDEATCYSR